MNFPHKFHLVLFALLFVTTTFAATPFDKIERESVEAATPEADVPYLVQLNSRVFLPRGNASSARSVNEKMYLQFERPLLAGERAELEAAGLVFHQTISSTTYVATVPAASVETLAQNPLFRGLEPVAPSDKLTASLFHDTVPEYAKRPNGTVDVFVRFYDDVSLSDALAVLDDFGIEVADRDQFLFGNRINVQSTTDRLLDLAASPQVRLIFEVSPPSKVFNQQSAGVANVSPLNVAPLNLTGSNVNIGIWDAGKVRNTHASLGTNRVILKESIKLCSLGSDLRSTNGVQCHTNTDCGPADVCLPYDDHSTHVAGTMISSLPGAARGMAPSAFVRLFSYNYYGEILTEMENSIAAAGDKIQLSNHSYGADVGWPASTLDPNLPGGQSENLFGLYTNYTMMIDELIRKTGHIMMMAAGNDGAQCKAGQSPSNPASQCDGILGTPSDGFRYHTIPDNGNAKNLITVGSIKDDGKNKSTFSSTGPSDDGRIKPDVVADGDHYVRSTCSLSDNDYCDKGGTSMASPVVAGAVALMVERWRNLHCGSSGAFPDAPLPELAKALLINSATDLGRPGPDFAYGHGKINAGKAVEQLEAPNAPANALCTSVPPTHYRIGFIENGEVLGFNITKPGQVLGTPPTGIKTTLAWTDLEFNPATAAPPPAFCSFDDIKVACNSNAVCQAIAPWATCGLACSGHTCHLVNDLNSMLLSPAPGSYLFQGPWIPPPVSSPTQAATNTFPGVNHVDNIEVIERGAFSDGGVFPLRVTGFTVNLTGNASERLQRFALVSNHPITFLPRNDNFADAKVLPTLVPPNFQATGCLTGENPCPATLFPNQRWQAVNFDATVEGDGDWARPTPDMKHSVWFKWTATVTGTAVFNTAGADFDTVLGAYIGTTLFNLSALDTNDNTFGYQSQVSFQVTAGITYYILVGGRPTFGDQSMGVFPLNYHLIPGAVDADLSLTTTLNTIGPYSDGQTIQYTVVVSNAGPNTATGVKVSNVGVNLLTTSVSSTPQNSCFALPCTITNLATGASETITLQAKILNGGAFNNATSVLADQNDPNGNNNYDSSGGTTTEVNTTVLNVNDSGPGSLRQVIADAPPFSDISFAANLPSKTITLISGQIPITKSVTIAATSVGGMTLSGGGASRVFDITGGEFVLVYDLTFTGGQAVSGGAVKVGSGRSFVTIDSSFMGNTATTSGGAIFNAGSVTFRNSTFSANAAPQGGALWNESSGGISLVNATISGNNAQNGGAILNSAGTVSLEHVTLSNNAATSFGGAIDNVGGTINIFNTIVAGNSCSGCPAPIPSLGPDAPPDIGNRTFGAVVSSGGNVIGSNATVTSIFPASALVGTAGAPLNAKLGPLQNNGGPTRTHLLLSGSAAIDNAVVIGFPEARDQRGFSRPSGPAEDIGAVEISAFGSLNVPVDLSVTKTLDNTAPYAIGQTLQYTLLVHNAGPGPATGVTISDTPANLLIDTVSSTPLGACTELPCTLAGLSIGETETITVLATIAAVAPFDNAASVSANEDDLNLGNNIDNTGNGGVAVASANLYMNLSLNTVEPHTAGQLIQYTLVVHNDGPSAATGVMVSHDPINLAVQSVVSTPQGSCNALPCTLTNLANGATETITVQATIIAEGAFDNAASVSGNEFDPDLANNNDSSGNGGATVASADIYVSKTLDTGGPFTVGQAVQYTLTVGNAGPNAATGIMVEDTPTNLTIETISSTPVGSCNVLPCVLADLASGATETITVQATIDSEGVFDNTTTVVANENDPNPGNNSDTTGNSGTTPVNTVVLNIDDDGPGSLRQIIALAPSGSVITFAPNLPAGVITLTTDQILIDNHLTIDASARPNGITISGDNTFRVFEIASLREVAMLNLVITGGMSDEGGGILNQGDLTLTDCSVRGNTSSGGGGGISNLSTLTLNRCTLSGNLALGGGGLFNSSIVSLATLTNSTISENATLAGGSGGGILNQFGEVSLNHVTIGNNTADVSGGGIDNAGGTINMENCIVAENTGPATDHGTEIANRTAKVTENDSSAGVINTGGANLVGNNDTVSTEFPEGALVGTPSYLLDPLLNPLQNNGGLTDTHMPQQVSPAINSALESSLPVDQRGFARPFGLASDLGSVERDTEKVFQDGFESE